MARIGVALPSFAAGEWSPRLYGRVDVAKYQGAAELIQNFIVRPEGGLMRRHGLRFAGELFDMSKQGLLVPFIFSTVQAYLLVFEDDLIRFYKDNAPITSNTLTITAITKANPAVVSYTGTDPSNGQKVLFAAIGGMVELNNREGTIANVNAGANTFEISGVNSTNYTTYTSGGTASVIYTVVSPYQNTDLSQLVFTQSADTLYIAHPSYAPRTLTRAAHTTWTLATLSLVKGPFAPLNTTDSAQVRVQATTYTPASSVTLLSNTDIFTADHVGSLFHMEEMLLDQLAVTPWAATQSFTSTVGTQYSSVGHVYAIAEHIGANGTGTVAPSHTKGDAFDNPLGATNRTKFRYLHSRYCIFQITSYTSAKQVTATALNYVPNGFNQPSRTITGAAASAGLIRITSNAHGYTDGDYVFVASVVGTTEANGYWQVINTTTNTYDLAGSTFANAYVSGGTSRRFATWLWRLGAFSAERGYPGALALHEQRLVFANTEAQPFGLWASKSGDYPNFLPGTNDDDPIDYNIAANQADPVRWLASSQDLLIGTLAQEFAAYGGGLGDPITPGNTRIVPQSGEGSNALRPIKVGTDVLFCNRAGRKVFALKNDAAVGGYSAVDLIELAEHLTLGKTITATAWAKNPLSVLWCLLSDGSVISLTYRPDQNVIAWSRMVISGTVESIAVIPSSDGTTDQLWLIVNRTINGGTKRYVEYLADPFEPTSATDKNTMGYLDSALRYNGSAVASVGGLFHLEGETVKVVAGGALHADCVVSGGKITLDASYTNVWAGIGYTSKLRTLRIEQGAQGTAQGKLKRIPRVTVRTINSLGGKAGPSDESTMDDLIKRALNDPTDASPPLYSGDTDVHIATDFDLGGQITITQDEALPLDITGVFPLVSGSEG